MKKITKTVKINSLSLAKTAAQFWARIDCDLQPLIQDKTLAEAIIKITEAIGKLEEIAKQHDKSNSTELTSDFQKTDKALEKMKTKVNDFQLLIEKIEHTFQEKLQAKLALLRKTDPKDASDKNNRDKVETHMKSIKNLIGTSKQKLQEIQEPTEIALKRLHAIKPKLYALGIPKTFESCQKRAEKLNEDIEALCHATAEMSLSDMVIASATVLFKEAAPTKLFLPKLQSEVEKTRKLIDQTSIHLRKIFPVSDGATSVAASEAGRAAVGNSGSPAAASVSAASSAAASVSSASAAAVVDAASSAGAVGAPPSVGTAVSAGSVDVPASVVAAVSAGSGSAPVSRLSAAASMGAASSPVSVVAAVSVPASVSIAASPAVNQPLVTASGADIEHKEEKKNGQRAI